MARLLLRAAHMDRVHQVEGGLGHPEQAPRLRSRFRLYRYQYILMPLILLVPILAVLGVLGETWKTETAAGGVLMLRVHYPDRLRYRLHKTALLTVKNIAATMYDTVEVHFDPAYLDAFGSVTLTPAPFKTYTIQLMHLAPGEAQEIRLDLEGERIGTFTGRVSARVGTTALPDVSVRLSTYTFW